MAIQAISQAAAVAQAPGVTAGSLQTAGGLQGAAAQAGMPAGELAGSFSQFLAGAIGQTNALQLQSEEMAKKLVTGQNVELHDVMIAMEKAGLAFELTMQVRNKMVEAYQEVMRMQI